MQILAYILLCNIQNSFETYFCYEFQLRFYTQSHVARPPFCFSSASMKDGLATNSPYRLLWRLSWNKWQTGYMRLIYTCNFYSHVYTYVNILHGRHVVHGSVLFITTVILCMFLLPKRSAHNFLCKYALYIHICAVYIGGYWTAYTARGKCPDWRPTTFQHTVLVPARPDNGWHLLGVAVLISLKN